MNLDLLVVVFYFLVIGAVGWLGVRRATTKEDYLVAGRNLGPCLYLGTLSAVVLGGASTIGSVKLGYTYGISGVWLCGALGAGIVVLSMVLAKPLLKLKLYTVSQVLARRYHPAARVTSGAIMLAYDLMVAVTSIIAIGSVMQVMFDLSFTASILLGGGLVVLYSTLGGMWSLTLTDIIQFIIMTVGMMLVLMPMSIVKAGGWAAFSSQLPDSYYQLSSIGLDTILVFFLIYFFGILIGQDIWQRVFTARSSNIARYAGLGAGGWGLLRAVWRDRCSDWHGRKVGAAATEQYRWRFCRHCSGGVAGGRQRFGGGCRVGGADVDGQRLSVSVLNYRAGGRTAGDPQAAFRWLGGRATHDTDHGLHYAGAGVCGAGRDDGADAGL